MQHDIFKKQQKIVPSKLLILMLLLNEQGPLVFQYYTQFYISTHILLNMVLLDAVKPTAECTARRTVKRHVPVVVRHFLYSWPDYAITI